MTTQRPTQQEHLDTLTQLIDELGLEVEQDPMTFAEPLDFCYNLASPMFSDPFDLIAAEEEALGCPIVFANEVELSNSAIIAAFDRAHQHLQR